MSPRSTAVIEEIHSHAMNDTTDEDTNPTDSSEAEEPVGGPPPEGDPGENGADQPVSELLNDPARLRSAIEALLFASPEPLSLGKLAEVLGDLPRATVREALEDLAAGYDEDNRGFRLTEVHGGFRLATREDFAEYIMSLRGRRRRPTLSGASLETLAIIAYRQPVIRATVDSIRGVESSGAIRNLVDMELIEVVGQKEVVGRPSLYATTTKFLEVVGLRALDDLPGIEVLKDKMMQEERARADEERAAREKADAEMWANADAAAKARKEAMREEARAHDELIGSIGKDLISGEEDDEEEEAVAAAAETEDPESQDPDGAGEEDEDEDDDPVDEYDEDEDEFDDEDEDEEFDDDDEDPSDELEEDFEDEEDDEDEDDDDDDEGPDGGLNDESDGIGDEDGEEAPEEREPVRTAPPLKQIAPPSPVNIADRIRATAAARNRSESHSPAPPADPARPSGGNE